MKFDYFTLSDNNYADNHRAPIRFVAEIIDEALYAETLGCERLHNVRPQDHTENAVLLGSPTHIIDVLQRVEAAGLDEVILYFNVGLKPHTQVKDEMARFIKMACVMEQAAPHFA